MKQTIFRFGLRFTADGPDLLSKQVEERIRAIKGVDNVDVNISHFSTELRVQVSFQNAEDAKKLHRKLVLSLLIIHGVSITRVTSNLTEVFE